MRKRPALETLFAIVLLAAFLSSLSACGQKPAPKRGMTDTGAPPASTLSAGPYYALVIGNNNYKYLRKLQTPINDATSLAKLLHERYGFATPKLLLDATRDDIFAVLTEYRRTLPENSSLVIFFAGHGHHDQGTDEAYWLPVDAEADNPDHWISANDITTNIRAIPSKHVLVISDSCYSGVLLRGEEDIQIKPERNAYLAQVLKSKSRNLMSSGGDEPVADNSPTGPKGHSVFANAVLKYLGEMEDEQFTAGDIFPKIRRGVAGLSPQLPQYGSIRLSGDEYGDFVFSRGGKGAVVGHDTVGTVSGPVATATTIVNDNSDKTGKAEIETGSVALDPQKPAALGPGVNKGNVDNGSGPHYYYFWAGPGHIDIKMAFKEMGVLGAPFRQALTFDLYDERGKVVSHNAVVSLANLERIKTGGDFGSRHKMMLAVVPQQGLVRLGGYYEIEVTGAAAFDGAMSANSDVKPKDTALYHSGVSLYQSGAMLYKPGQALVVSETEKEVRVVLAADVLFDFDKAMIRPDAASALKQAAALIREKHRSIVRVEGHTDSRGGSVYNMQLSKQRAAAVETWLVQNEGFDAAIFRTKGFGATRPVAPNVKPDGGDNPEGRQRNRRVELLIAK